LLGRVDVTPSILLENKTGARISFSGGAMQIFFADESMVESSEIFSCFDTHGGTGFLVQTASFSPMRWS
jgi:hypothetical protein